MQTTVRGTRHRVMAAGGALLSAGILLAACGGSTPAASSTTTAGGGSPTSSTGAPSSSSSTQASTSSGGGHFTIGFSNPQGTQPVLDAFQKALGVAAKRAGDKVIPLNAGLSVSKQVSDIQELITDKVDAIVVFPLAAQALVPALTHARKAGIKVVGYNAVTTETATSASLYPYNADINQGIIHQGAKQAAQFVAQQLHGKGNVLGVNISLSVPSLDAFIASEKQDVTSANPGIHWVGTAFDQTDDIAGADSSVASALTKYHNKVQAVMAYFDGAAIGAARALQSVGVKNVVIVGQQGNTDGIQAVKDGTISATINEMPYQQALIAFTMVKDLLAGKTVPLVIHPPVQFITKSNLSQYVPWTTGIQEIADGKLTPPTSLSSQPGA